MRIKTQAGVAIVINSEGASKIMFFDKPVRAIELTKEEMLQVSTALASDVKVGIAAELRKLLMEGFFENPQSFANIKRMLTEKGVRVKSASLNTILNKMMERNELVRTGKRGSYLYQRHLSINFKV
jgi:predicted GTPase